MKVTERFTRVDADTDPYNSRRGSSTWTTPWTAEMSMQKTKGPLFEHACHEGNYGLYNTLVGARLEEKKAAEEAAKNGASSNLRGGCRLHHPSSGRGVGPAGGHWPVSSGASHA